jgi:hypothetical protein
MKQLLIIMGILLALTTAKAEVFTVSTINKKPEETSYGTGFLINTKKGKVGITALHICAYSDKPEIHAHIGPNKYRLDVNGIVVSFDLCFFKAGPLTKVKAYDLVELGQPVTTDIMIHKFKGVNKYEKNFGVLRMNGTDDLAPLPFKGYAKHIIPFDIYMVSIAEGSSGGPVIDEKTGKVVGMVAIMTKDGFTLLAIPGTLIRRVLNVEGM